MITIEQLLTDKSGKVYTEEQITRLWDDVCKWKKSIDSDWNWKEMVSYEFQYTNADSINAYVFAIEFFVGGKTDIYITPTKNDGTIVTLVNRGYYANIGA